MPDDPRQKDTQPAEAPRGRSGRSAYGGFLNVEELNIELQGWQGLQIFDKMYRTDPDCKRALAMVFNPIIGGTWSVEPAGGEDATAKAREIAEFVKWALFEKMRPTWDGHLQQFLPVLLRSGFTPGEQVFMQDTYKGRRVLVLRQIGLRLPRTIRRWHQDEYGELVAIEQWLPWLGDPWVARPDPGTRAHRTGMDGGRSYTPIVGSGFVEIPADDLVYYRIGAEGDNWEGQSLLRSAYKPWKLKDGIEKIDAVGNERESLGIPIVYPPSSATEDQIGGVEALVKDLRAGHDTFVRMPGPHAQDVEAGGWRLDILGLGGGEGKRDPHKSLEYHRKGIAAAVIAEFMMLGQGSVGARATADVQQDPFLAGVDAIASVVRDEANQSIIPRLCHLNYGDDELPKLTMSLVDATTLTELKDYVGGLVSAGVLVPDEPLEDFLRQQGHLPSADPTARKDAKDAKEAARGDNPPKPGAAPKPGRPGKDTNGSDPEKVKTMARQDRPLRGFEGLIMLDAIESTLEAAREDFQRAGGELTRQLARQAAEKVSRGQDPSRSRNRELEAAIADVLGDLYFDGRRTVRHELEAQRRGEWPEHSRELDRDGADRPKGLLRRARLSAAAIVNRIADEILRIGLAGQTDVANLTVAGETAANAALRGEAQLHASAALNEGRDDEADEQADEIRGAYYTSILDVNRCPTCAASDDEVLRPLTDPVRVARKPPNAGCDGGSRCRCMEVFVLKSEASPSAGMALARDPAVLRERSVVWRPLRA